MKPKHLLGLSLFLVGCLVFYLLAQRPQRGTISTFTGTPRGTRLFAELQTDDVARIEIQLGQAPATVLQRKKSEQETRWELASAHHYPAHATHVAELLAALRRTRVEEGNCSTNPKNHDRFEVDEALGLRLTLRDAAGKVLAALIIGKETRIDRETYCYARRPDQDEVVSLFPNLSQKAGAEAPFGEEPRRRLIPTYWADLKLIACEKNKIREVRLTRGEKIVVLRSKVSGPDKRLWTADADGLRFPADENVVNRILDRFASFEVNDLADPTKKKDYEIDPPKATAVAVLDDKSKKEIAFGKEEGGKHYVRAGTSPFIYKLDDYPYGSLFKAKEELLRKKLFDFDQDDLVGLHLTQGGRTLQLKRDKTWQLDGPPDFPLSDQKVSDLARDLADFEVTRFAASDAEAGFDKPTAVVVTRLKDGRTYTLTFGAQVKDKDEFYLRCSEPKADFVVSEASRDQLLKQPEDLREKPKADQKGAD